MSFFIFTPRWCEIEQIKILLFGTDYSLIVLASSVPERENLDTLNSSYFVENYSEQAVPMQGQKNLFSEFQGA
jgi:hypothetical protein